jgi:hypothetical protein
MGRWRDRIVSEPKKNEPAEDLLEFLGGIDEVNEDSRQGDFSDFLANTDIEKAAQKPSTPGKEDKRE